MVEHRLAEHGQSIATASHACKVSIPGQDEGRTSQDIEEIRQSVISRSAATRNLSFADTPEEGFLASLEMTGWPVPQVRFLEPGKPSHALIQFFFAGKYFFSIEATTT
jgi:hypothetical protein